MLQQIKLRDLIQRDAPLILQAQGELKRSLKTEKLPTELHMI